MPGARRESTCVSTDHIAHTRRPVTCVFCGSAGPLSDEDVVPRWIIRGLGLQGPAVLTLERTGTPPVVHRRMRRMKLLLRNVCRKCNTTLMSTLENRVSALALPAMKGLAALSLSPTDQRLMATWATMKALLMERAYADTGEHAYSPPSNLKYLYEHRRPPPADDTRVWIGALNKGWRDVWHQASAFLPSGEAAEPDDRTGWYLATVAFGHVVLQVFGRDIQPNVFGQTSARRPNPVWSLPIAWARHLSPIWPSREEPVAWPPEQIIPEDDLLLMQPPIR